MDKIKKSEVKKLLDNFQFETFVDVHSNIFEEYLNSAIAKLSKDNTKYRAVSEKITSLYEQYPNVLGVLDMEKPCGINEQECKTLIEILSLRNKLYAVESEAIYFRGCYAGVGCLKKTGIL
ncbi:MAG: DUF6664 family protein [Eubacterium sp.]